MPYNGSGSFSALPPPAYPAVPGEPIRADYFNAVIQDLMDGLTNAITRNGQTPASTDLPMGGKKHTNAAAAVAAGQYLVYGQNVPTQAPDNSSQLIATTAFVLGQLAAAASPAIGSATIGVSKRMARQDHSHPFPTTKGVALTGAVTGSANFAADGGVSITTTIPLGTSSLGNTSGYVKLGPFLLQYLQVNGLNGGDNDITWPIAFPTVCFGAVGSYSFSFATDADGGIGVRLWTTTGAKVRSTFGTAATPAAFVIAIGK